MTTPDSSSDDKRRVDMSPEAIDRRLREVAELRRLGLSLAGGTWLGRVRDRP